MYLIKVRWFNIIAPLVAFAATILIVPAAHAATYTADIKVSPDGTEWTDGTAYVRPANATGYIRWSTNIASSTGSCIVGNSPKPPYSYWTGVSGKQSASISQKTTYLIECFVNGYKVASDSASFDIAPSNSLRVVTYPMDLGTSGIGVERAFAPVMLIHLYAGTSAVNVHTISVSKHLLTGNSAIQGAIVTHMSGKRVSQVQGFDSSGVANIPVSISVPAGGSAVYMISAYMNSNLDAYNGKQFSLVLKGMSGNGIIVGSFPATGYIHTIDSSVVVGTLAMSGGGSGSAPAGVKEIIGKFAFQTSSEPVVLIDQTYLVSFTGAGCTQNCISDITMSDDTGSFVAGPVDLQYLDGAAYFTFDDSVDAGWMSSSTTYTIRANLTRLAEGQAVTISTYPNLFLNPFGRKERYHFIASPSNAISQTTTIPSGVVYFGPAQYSAKNATAGTNSVEMGKYILDASERASGVRALSVPLDLYVGTPATQGQLSKCELRSPLGQLSQPVYPSATTTSNTSYNFVFSSPVVASSTPITLSVQCDLKPTASGLFSWRAASPFTVTDIASNREIAVALKDPYTLASTYVNPPSQVPYSVRLTPLNGYKTAVAGSVGVSLGQFKFTNNASESILLEHIAFKDVSGWSNQLENRQASLWYGTTYVAPIYFDPVTGEGFARNAGITIPSYEAVTLTIKGNIVRQQLGYDGVAGAVINIGYDGSKQGLEGNYAYGMNSHAAYTGSTELLVGAGTRVFRTLPTVTDVSTSGTTLAAGVDLNKIKVSADPGRDVTLRKMTFEVAVAPNPCVSASDFVLLGPSGQVHDGSVQIQNGLVNVTFKDTNPDRIIPAGTSKTYTLRASTISGISLAYGGMISSRLRQDKNYPFSTIASVSQWESLSGSENNNFIWSPNTISTPEATTATNLREDWANSLGVPGYPAVASDMPYKSFGAVTGTCATAPIIATSTPAYSTNIVTNPGFESQKNGWSGWGTRVKLSPSEKYTGTYGMEFVHNTTGTRTLNNGTTYSVVPGSKVLASAYVKAVGSGTTDAFLELEWRSASGSILKRDQVAYTGGATAWTKIEKTLTVPANATKLKIRLKDSATPSVGSVFFDDVSVQLAETVTASEGFFSSMFSNILTAVNAVSASK